MVRGVLKFKHPIGYFISAEIKGPDHVQSGDSSLGFTDVEFNTSLGRLGTLRVGKIKEPFVYEMVGDAANLQQQERALNPFFTSRGIGARLSKPFARDAMSWSVGWYNDWWVTDQPFGESGNDFVGRLTAVPYWKGGGSSYVHLGAGVRYVGADEGTLRFRGRPESNVTDDYVDSGSLAGDHATDAGVEFLAGRGPLLVSAEYARAAVDAPDSGNPRFWGSYVAVSYVLTGEHRPYDKQVAYARRIQPLHRAGAWELVGRFSHVDVRDRLVDGGVFDRWTAGVNWWATRRWKLGFDYGFVDLDRGGLTGVTHAFHSRLQWVY
jgi:phosphate-selective porin